MQPFTPTQMGLLQISGKDAKKFLQGQLTCNLDEITSTRSLRGAHCNPQGRIISLFTISLSGEDYDLQMPRELVPIALKALQKYAVFFKVSLTDVSETLQPSYLDKEQAIRQGIAEIYPETSGKFLPHELNLPELGAVSFNKGCYTGQEIIARMHYRGKLKNHLYYAKIQTSLPILRGNDIYLQGKSKGSIVDYCQIAYNTYELLVIADENDVRTGQLTIDGEEKYPLTF